MDKQRKYAEIIARELKKIAAIPFYNAPDLKSDVVIDKEEENFILFTEGWKKGLHKYGVTLHFQLKDGKVLFLENGTDIDWGERFKKMGIPKSDMVIKFVHPIERDEEYAGAIV